MMVLQCDFCDSKCSGIIKIPCAYSIEKIGDRVCFVMPRDDGAISEYLSELFRQSVRKGVFYMKKIAIGLSLLICLNFASNASAEYYVQKGDTMAKIAQKYDMKLRDLISLNPQHPNPAEIHVGDFMVVREKAKQK